MDNNQSSQFNINQQEQLNQKKNKDFRNIALTIVGVMIIIGVISGGTFAYFAFNASNASTITGVAANASVTLTVTKVSSQATGALVPQLTSAVNKAIVGTSNKKCVDGNGNTVCQIYQLTTTNSSTAAFAYRINLKFSFSSVFTNLKYAVIPAASVTATTYTSVTVGTATSATASDQSVGSGTLVSSTGTATYYVVVWINETLTTQNSTDKGTFTGTVTLTDSAGKAYLTSTFT